MSTVTPEMNLAIELHTFRLFCYDCKQVIDVRAADEKQAKARFKQSGHSDDKVPALAPDFGRRSRRYDKAIAKYQAKLAAERREADAQREAHTAKKREEEADG